MADITASLLIYDIPEGRKIGNPSKMLRRRAVRVNLSCWVIPDGMIPYSMLSRMEARGATWHVVKFDAGEGEKLLRMVTDSLTLELQGQMARTKSSLERAHIQCWDDQEETGNHEKAEKDYRTKTKAILANAAKLTNDLGEAARGFGLPYDRINVPVPRSP